jgi:hypothetical protein
VPFEKVLSMDSRNLSDIASAFVVSLVAVVAFLALILPLLLGLFGRKY